MRPIRVRILMSIRFSPSPRTVIFIRVRAIPIPSTITSTVSMKLQPGLIRSLGLIGSSAIRVSHIFLSVPPLRMKSTTGAATISGGMMMSIPNVSTIQPSSTLSLRRWISQRRRSRPILMAISVVIAMRKIRNVKSKL